MPHGHWKTSPIGKPGGRRRRPAPTIDLKATEVASEPRRRRLQPADPPRHSRRRNRRRRRRPEPPPRADHPAEPPKPPPPWPGIAWLPPGVPWPVVGAGAAGAAAVLLVVLLIWLIVPRAAAIAVATLTPRLAAIETQLRDLAARPAPAGRRSAGDRRAVGAARASSKARSPRRGRPATDPALASRVGALESAIKPLADSVAALTRRADEADAAFRNVRGRADALAAALAELQNAARASSADHGEIAKLSSRIAALEKTDRAVADQLPRARHAAATGRCGSRSRRRCAPRSSAAIRSPPSLRRCRPLAGDANALAALEPFAASGVPGAAALGRELAASCSR